MVEPTAYDSAWKDALHAFLEPAFAFFFPTVHPAIDWTHPPEWLDKDLESLTPDSARGKQIVDVLLRLWRTDGPSVLVIVHIEIQSQYDVGFAARMFDYYCRLHTTYTQPITSLAILGDERPAWKPRSHSEVAPGTDMTLNFTSAKLLDYTQEMLHASPNPFAAIVLAHRVAQQTQGDDAARAAAKVAAILLLYERGYSDAVIRALRRVLDRLLTLPTPTNRAMWQEVKAQQEAKNMTYLTYPEEQAVIEATHRTIGRILVRKFGADGGALVADVARVEDIAALDQLTVDISVATTLDEVRRAIAAATTAPTA